MLSVERVLALVGHRRSLRRAPSETGGSRPKWWCRLLCPADSIAATGTPPPRRPLRECDRYGPGDRLQGASLRVGHISWDTSRGTHLYLPLRLRPVSR